MRNFFLFFMIVLVSCIKENKEEIKNPLPDSSQTKIEDSLSLNNPRKIKISKDSFSFSCHFVDKANVPIRKVILFEIFKDTTVEIFQTNQQGEFSSRFKKGNNLVMTYQGDELISIPSQFDDAEISTVFVLNLLPLRGRIMDRKGTPLANMPVQIYRKKGKRGKYDFQDNDPVIYTDSAGYYFTYLRDDAYSIVLHSCGFLVGEISKKEWKTYPKHNFLFEPFSVENTCDGFTPDAHFSLSFSFQQDEEPTVVSLRDWTDLFPYHNQLEAYDMLTVYFNCENYTGKRTVKKRSCIFRNQSFSVCF